MDDKFTWKEDDLEIEDPIGSGRFIPLREFNRRIAAEKARERSEMIMREDGDEKGKSGFEESGQDVLNRKPYIESFSSIHLCALIFCVIRQDYARCQKSLMYKIISSDFPETPVLRLRRRRNGSFRKCGLRCSCKKDPPGPVLRR